jgi:uncharacterized membrane protein YkvI
VMISIIMVAFRRKNTASFTKINAMITYILCKTAVFCAKN